MPSLTIDDLWHASVTIPCQHDPRCRAAINFSLRSAGTDNSAHMVTFEKMKRIARAFAVEEGWDLEKWRCPAHKEGRA